MNYQIFVFKYTLDGDGSSSPNFGLFFLFFKSNSHMSINNENFAPCKFIQFETNLEGVFIYRFAEICVWNELIEFFCIS